VTGPDLKDGRLYRLIRTRAGLDSLPDPSPLIDDTLDTDTLAVLAGPWGTCKTFLALDWAASTATGTSWNARAVKPGRVLYVATEGVHGLRARVHAWEQDHAAKATKLDFLPVPVDLAGRRSGHDVDELAAIVADQKYALVVFDTLARCLIGADENSARDVGEAVDALDRIRRASGACVLAVHHMSKPNANGARTVRGSSALEGAADTVYTLAGAPLQLTMERTKRKDGPTPDRVSLRLEQASESAVLKIIPETILGLDAESHLVRVMRDHFALTGASATMLRDVAELPKTTFYRALQSLVRQGILVNRGTEKRKVYCLADATLDDQDE
jgi:RecA-family ATPase